MKPISLTKGLNPSGDNFDDKSMSDKKVRSSLKAEPKTRSLNYPRGNSKPQGQALTASGANKTGRAKRLPRFDKRNFSTRGRTNNLSKGDGIMNDQLSSKTQNASLLSTPIQYSIHKTGDSIKSTSYSVNQSDRFTGLFFNNIKINLLNWIPGQEESILDRCFRLFFLNDFRAKVYATMNRSVNYNEDLVVEYLYELGKLVEMFYNVTAILKLKDGGNNTLSRLYRMKTDAGFASEVRHIQAALEGKPFPNKWNQFIHFMYQTYMYSDTENSILIRNFYRGFGLTGMYSDKVAPQFYLSRKTLQDQITLVNDPKFAEVDSYLRLAMGWSFSEIPPSDITYNSRFTEYWVNSDINVQGIHNISFGKGSALNDLKYHVSQGNNDGFVPALRAYYTDIVESIDGQGIIPVNKYGLIDYLAFDVIGQPSIADYSLTSSRMKYSFGSDGLLLSVPCLLAGDSVSSGCANNMFVITPQSGEIYGIETTPAGFNTSTAITQEQMEEVYFSNLKEMWS